MNDNQDRILIIEDDPNIEKLLRLYLERAGFVVISTPDGESGLEWVEQQLPQLIILDLMLPGIDGLEVCERLRRKHEIPIIMLTALDSTGDKVTGLEMGSDDYITKPFDPNEVVARVKAVLRRSSHATRGSHLEFPDFTIDYDTRKVVRNGEEIYLTAKEFELLWLLANHPSRVFTRDQLLDRIWGYEFFGNIRTVDVHIRHLREKLELRPEEPRYIQTLWGVGYKLEPGGEEKDCNE